MLVSLIQHERIKTTLAKAKELRSWADKMITLGKKNTLHARRRAFALLRDEGMVKKLFDEIAPRFKERQGGYTRIYKMGWRTGDSAPLSLIEWTTLSTKEKKKKAPPKKAKAVVEKAAPEKKVKEEKKEKGKEKEEKKTTKLKKKEEKETSEKKPKEKSSEEKSK
jgi:large subunit ribosomal protein L17